MDYLFTIKNATKSKVFATNSIVPFDWEMFICGHLNLQNMKTHLRQISFNRTLNAFERSGKSSSPVGILMVTLLITLYGCGKPSDNPTPPVVNITNCAIASDVDETLGLRNFEYDDQGLLTKMTAPNYYYGPFVRTITPAKVNDTFTNYNATYSCIGGTGNIYDGNPEFINQSSVGDLYQLKYDANKRLVSVLVPMPANGYWKDTFFTIFRAELNFTYDANDNVTQVKIVKDYQEEINVPQTGESRIDYMQITDDVLNITYDDKPSPYTAISKYWEFTGPYFLNFKIYSLNLVRFWANVSAVLSKNNPVKITGKLTNNDALPPNTINSTLTYQYNEQGFPVSIALDGSGINSFTYNCK
jgi:hypothetical protein